MLFKKVIHFIYHIDLKAIKRKKKVKLQNPIELALNQKIHVFCHKICFKEVITLLSEETDRAPGDVWGCGLLSVKKN